MSISPRGCCAPSEETPRALAPAINMTMGWKMVPRTHCTGRCRFQTLKLITNVQEWCVVLTCTLSDCITLLLIFLIAALLYQRFECRPGCNPPQLSPFQLQDVALHLLWVHLLFQQRISQRVETRRLSLCLASLHRVSSKQAITCNSMAPSPRTGAEISTAASFHQSY